MRLDIFEKKLLEENQVKISFNFTRPKIKESFHEEYLFKKEGNNFVCYENNKKGFEANTIKQIYFIYGKIIKLFNSKKRKKGRYKEYYKFIGQ